VILTADDFGLSAGVNEGILRAHAAGGLTATTVLVNGIAAGDVSDLPGRWPDLDVGLHVNLTLGIPVSDPARIPSIVDTEGRFIAAPELLARARRGRVRQEDVRREVGAQVRRLRGLGVEPTHWDAHQQAAFQPGLVGPTAAAAAEAGLRRVRAPWVHPVCPGLPSVAARARWWLANPLRIAGDGHRALAAARLRRRFAAPGRQLSPALVIGGGSLAARWRALLSAVPDGTSEVVSHPAVPDDDLRRLAPMSAEGRATDLRVLSDPGLEGRLRSCGVALVGFRALQ
jgi:predicted glycoside hydrolase/deacetylase ChbG (UPF0249 family)